MKEIARKEIEACIKICQFLFWGSVVYLYGDRIHCLAAGGGDGRWRRQCPGFNCCEKKWPAKALSPWWSSPWQLGLLWDKRWEALLWVGSVDLLAQWRIWCNEDSRQLGGFYTVSLDSVNADAGNGGWWPSTVRYQLFGLFTVDRHQVLRSSTVWPDRWLSVHVSCHPHI